MLIKVAKATRNASRRLKLQEKAKKILEQPGVRIYTEEASAIGFFPVTNGEGEVFAVLGGKCDCVDVREVCKHLAALAARVISEATKGGS